MVLVDLANLLDSLAVAVSQVLKLGNPFLNKSVDLVYIISGVSLLKFFYVAPILDKGLDFKKLSINILMDLLTAKKEEVSFLAQRRNLVG